MIAFPSPFDRPPVNLSREQERELVSRARAGDRDAFGTLYASYHDHIRRLAAPYVGGDWGAAEDVAAGAFTVALERIGELDHDGAFVSWLRSITRFKALQHQSRARKETATEGVGDGFVAGPGRPVDEEAIYRIGLRQMAATARRLSISQRTALALWIEGAALLEIAARLGVGRQVASHLLCQARGALLDGFYLGSHSLASLVRSGRERAGLTRAELAARAGVGLDAIKEIEQGRSRSHTETVLAIAAALRLPAGAFEALQQVTQPQERPRSRIEHKVACRRAALRVSRRREVAA